MMPTVLEPRSTGGASSVTRSTRTVSVTVLFDVVQQEHDRRQSRGVRALSNLDMLRGLADDPRASIGVPVVPQRVIVRAERWRSGVRALATYAGYCERHLVVDRPRNGSDELELECSFFGIGLRYADGGDSEALSAAPFLPARFSLASWLFAEQLYDEWLRRD
jgi:hypothetical protein